MADQGTGKPPRMRTWVRVLLGVSLALNLAVVGIAAGAALRFGKPDGTHRPPPPIGALLYRELSREDRKEMRSRAAETRQSHGDRRKDEVAQIDAALRAVPFDPVALNEVLSAQTRKREAFQDEVQQLWLKRVSEMSDKERAAYADRLKHAVERHGPHGKPSKYGSKG